MENGSNNTGPPIRGGFRGRGGMPRGSFDGRGRGRGMGRGGPMGSMPRGFNGPPGMRRGLLRGLMPRGMNFRGGPPRGSPRGGRPMNYNYSNQASHQGPPSNDVPQKSETSPNPGSNAQQTPKQAQNNSHSPSNDPGNTVSVNQSPGVPPSSKGMGNPIRGGRGGGMSQRRGNSSAGNYNSNINVTGNDIHQGSSPSKPFYRGGLSRGRGNMQQNLTRPNGPMQITPNHQPGMMQPGMPLKRGPPIGPPGPKRGRYDQTPTHRMQKYQPMNMQGPQGPQGPPTHLQGPPNQHQQTQSQPNYSNNYSNAIPQIQHHNNYYGPQGNGGYDQTNQMNDYSQNYAPPQSGYNTNGYSQYSQQSYSQPSEYDHSQGYSQDYNATTYQTQDNRYPNTYAQPDYNATQYGTSSDYNNTSSSDYAQTGSYDNRSYSGYAISSTSFTSNVKERNILLRIIFRVYI